MLSARFEYNRPETLDEALGLLEEYGEDAKILAGGMSLIPLMKLRFAVPERLVDIGKISGLDGISESDEHLRVGAMTTHGALETSGILSSRYPAMSAAAPLVSDPIIRRRGTIGGSLSHADPAGDWGAVMLAQHAEVVVRSRSGERVVGIDDFLVDTFTTALQPNEILTEIRVPAPQGGAGGSYLKLERKVGDFATVGAAVQLWLRDGVITQSGIGLTAVGSKNIRAADAESILENQQPGDELFAEAGRRAAAVAQPQSDLRGSVEYKRNVVEAFVRRGLARAVELAGTAA